MPLALILFVTVPLGEIFLLIEIGSIIGGLETIALCLGTAALGTFFLRQQGLRTLNRARQNMDQQKLPAIELLEGVALLVGGVLLLTPGFVTDFLGFLCLLPPTRRWMVSLVVGRLVIRYGPPGGPGGPHETGQGPVYRDREGHRVIEGEFERRDSPDKDRD